MNEKQRQSWISELRDEAAYYEEQAVFCRHAASHKAASKGYWDEQAKTYDKMSKDRLAESRRLSRE